MSKQYKRKEQKINAIQYNGKNLRDIKKLIPDLKEWQEFWKGRNLQYKPNKSDYFLIDVETNHVDLISQDDFNSKYQEINKVDYNRLFNQDTDYGHTQPTKRPNIPSTGVIIKDGLPQDWKFLYYPCIIGFIIMLIIYAFYKSETH